MQIVFLIIFLCAIMTNFGNGTALVYQFGKIPPFSATDYIRGEILANQRIVEVPLDIYPCRKVEYARIVINNPYSEPSVGFDETARKVIFTYEPNQFSASTYEIEVKNRRIIGCNTNRITPLVQPTKDSRISLDYYGY